MKKLLQFSDWYGDEFPIMGFIITDQEGWDVLQDICKDIDGIFKIEDYHYLYVEFGTNISPCLVKSVENKDYIYMILPVRLKD